jgi:O-acetyl-ADP-ribose deacetylase (regulator of RNase III)
MILFAAQPTTSFGNHYKFLSAFIFKFNASETCTVVRTLERLEIGEIILELVRGDITKQDTDAIVNAANTRLAPGGGVAGAIHRAAGPGLWEECKTLGGCRTGEAKLTSGYALKATYVIHTVGPVYSGSSRDAEELRACYRNSLRLADENGIRSVSFPAISTGAFGYPLKEAAQISLTTVIEYLKEETGLKLVRFVLYSQSAYDVFRDVLTSLK